MQAVCGAISQAVPDFQATEHQAERQARAERPDVQDWTFAGGGRARVAEAFWGDLSLVRGSIPDIVRALAYNLYGAIHVSKRSLQTTSRVTRFLPIVPFYLVRWVVLPLHLVLLALAMPIAVWLLLQEHPGAGDYLTSHGGLFTGLAAAWMVAGVAAAIIMARRQGRRVRPQAWDIAAAFSVWALLSLPFGTRPVAAWVESCATRPPIGKGTWATIIDIATARFGLTNVCALLLSSTPIGHTGEGKVPVATGIGRYIAINEFVGDAAFFLCAILVLLYILLTALYALLGRRATARAMLLVAAICCLFVVTTAILLEIPDFIARMIQFWDRSVTVVYWYEVILAFWLAVVAVGVAVSVVLRRRRARAEGHAHGAKFAYSRVIVSRLFQMSVIGATLVLIGIFLGRGYIPSSLYVWGVPLLLVAPGFLALLVAALVFSRHLRLGLDIAMDIINHFVHSRDEFPVRRAISQRFYDVLDRLTADGDRPHLLVVAHSQGSVITVDALLKDIWRKPFSAGRPPLGERVSSMTILTFGSPVTHIYQHYFPKDYAPFIETSLKDLAGDERVRWLNIYREDDPIGTHIEGPREDFPRNIDMPNGGHVRYWEKEIFASPDVRRHLPGAG